MLLSFGFGLGRLGGRVNEIEMGSLNPWFFGGFEEGEHVFV